MVCVGIFLYLILGCGLQYRDWISWCKRTSICWIVLYLFVLVENFHSFSLAHLYFSLPHNFCLHRALYNWICFISQWKREYHSYQWNPSFYYKHRIYMYIRGFFFFTYENSPTSFSLLYYSSNTLLVVSMNLYFEFSSHHVLFSYLVELSWYWGFQVCSSLFQL